jgi:hypothetical protein
MIDKTLLHRVIDIHKAFEYRNRCATTYQMHAPTDLPRIMRKVHFGPTVMRRSIVTIPMRRCHVVDLVFTFALVVVVMVTTR